MYSTPRRISVQQKMHMFKLASVALLLPLMAIPFSVQAGNKPPFPPTPVTVTNTSANPVPVTGSVSVTASTPLPVTGTFTATLPSAVSVSNAPTAPLFTSSVSDTGRAPAQIHLSGILESGTGGVDEVTSSAYTVPAGKRLVVQQVTGSVSRMGPATLVGVRIHNGPTPLQSQSELTPVVLSTPVLAQADANNTLWISAQGPAYFDSGTSVGVGASFSLGGGTIGFSGADYFIIGYLLDCAQVACAPIVSQ
jgi:hypothetical protein